MGKRKAKLLGLAVAPERFPLATSERPLGWADGWVTVTCDSWACSREAADTALEN